MLLSYDRETGEIKREGHAKSTNAPIFKLVLTIGAAMTLFILTNMVNISYVEYMGGKVSQSSRKKFNEE